MKKFIVAVVCLITVPKLFAQQGPKGFVTLSGKITNPIGDSIKVSYYYDADIAFLPRHYGSRIDGQGRFSIKFPVALSYTDVTVEHGNQSTTIVVAPGYQLELFDDANNFDSSLRFTGKGAAVENFLAKHSTALGLVDEYGREANALYIKEPADFEQALHNGAQKHIDLLEQNKAGIPATFIAYYNARYTYANYNAMLCYPFFHELHKQKTFASTKDLPRENFSVVAHVPEQFDDRFVGQASYNSYLSNYYCKIEALGKHAFTSDTTEKEETIMLHHAYAHMPPKTAESFAAGHIKNYAKQLSLAKTEQELKEFKEHYPHSSYIKELDRITRLNRTLGPGAIAPDFAITTPDGEHMNLSDLRGKVVYLDFWASWCAGCIADMPHAKTIHEHYKDRNVVFVNVSIDEQVDAWKKAMTKYGVSGINTRMHEDSPEAKLYGIQGVPYYFLIDKKGTFVLAEELRPSDEEKLKTAIDKLLE